MDWIGHKGTYRGNYNVLYFDQMVVTWVLALIKTHQIVQLRYVQFPVAKFHLNKKEIMFLYCIF